MKNKEHIINSVSAALAKIVTVLVSFMVLPAVSNAFGREMFGVWVVILSFSALLNFSDFGIGNGIISLTALNYNKNTEFLRNGISSAVMFVAVTGVVLLIAYIFFGRSMVYSVFGVMSEANKSDAKLSADIFFATFFLAMPLSIATKVQIGLNRGYLNSALQVIGSVGAYFLIGYAVKNNFKFHNLVALYVAPNIAMSIINNIILFFTEKYIRPMASFEVLRNAKSLYKRSSAFFILQINAALYVAADNYIISNNMSVAEAGDFAIVQKIFGAVIIVVGLYLQPLWPIYSRAKSNKDFGFIKNKLIKSSVFSIILSVIAGFLVVVFGNDIVSLWIGVDRNYEYGFLLAFAFSVAVEVQMMCLATVMNGLGFLRVQVYFGVLVSVLSIAIKLSLVKIYGYGVLPLVNGVVSAIVGFFPMVFWMKKYWRS